ISAGGVDVGPFAEDSLLVSVSFPGSDGVDPVETVSRHRPPDILLIIKLHHVEPVADVGGGVVVADVEDVVIRLLSIDSSPVDLVTAPLVQVLSLKGEPLCIGPGNDPGIQIADGAGQQDP